MVYRKDGLAGKIRAAFLKHGWDASLDTIEAELGDVSALGKAGRELRRYITVVRNGWRPYNWQPQQQESK